MAERPLPAEPAFISRQVTRARRFYLNLKAAPRPRLAVVCGGWEHCASDYAVDRPDFPFYSVEFVDGGRGQLELAGLRFDLSHGALFSYGPGVAHRIRSDPADRLRKYFVDFTGLEGKRLLTQIGLAPGTFSRTAAPAMRDLFELLIRIGAGGAAAGRPCALQLEVLLLCARGQKPAGPRNSTLAQTTFERCRQHLDLHFLTLATVLEAAEASGVDPAYLCRLFQRFARQSPYQYLTRLKMNWAADRLHDGRRLVREVADQLGIDPFQFSRTFKRIHGVAPSVFLARHSVR